MLQGHRTIWQFGPLLSPTNDNGNNEDDSDLDKIEGLGDKGKDAIIKERKARREADKALKDLTEQSKTLADQVKTLADEKAQRDKDAAAQAEKDREAKGEFEQLATKRAEERDNAIKERDEARNQLKEAQERYTNLQTIATNAVKTDFEALPEEVREVYPGAADDPVAMLEFIPKGKKLAERINAAAGDTSSAGKPGAKPDPKPAGGGDNAVTEDDKAAKEAMARRYQ